MKKIVISNYKKFGEQEENMSLVVMGDEIMEASDGYHTFGELYDHRIMLFIALCEVVMAGGFYKNPDVWRSKLHSDGSSFDGWFILGLNREKGKQITYHIPIALWENTDFAETLEKAPEYDGHTSSDVLGRLKKL